jgi:transposase-like protein
MSMNRIQFQPGMSVSELHRAYGSEAQCEAALTRARWPSGFVCPHCGALHAVSFRLHGKPGWQCRDCDKQTTLTAGTIFHSTKLPLTTWFQAMYFLTQTKNNVSALELRRLLGVSYPMAWRIKHKLMQVMIEREAPRKLAGRVEVDDAYLGGAHPGGKRGRGSENKTPFIAAIATRAGRPSCVRFDRVTTFSSDSVEAWARMALAPRANTVSDGLPAFRRLGVYSAHVRIVTGGGPHSVTLPTFRWVNTLLSNLKTALSGTYHAFDFDKYGHRYLAEFQYRFNRRNNLKSILPRLLRADAVTTKRTEVWLRLPEYQC